MVATEEDTAYLIQNCGDGFVVREFVIRMLVKASDYRKPMYVRKEQRRFVYDSQFGDTEYYYGYDRTLFKERWIEGELCASFGPGYKYYVKCTRGKVYKRNLGHLQKGILKRTGLLEYARETAFVNPVEYLERYRTNPWLERIVKARLTTLAKEIVQHNKQIAYRKEKKLGNALFIDSFRLQRLRERGGGSLYLNWLRFEKTRNTVIPDEVIAWMNENEIQPEDLTFIQDYMSVVQVRNYLKRQSEMSGETPRDLLGIWQDYLIMAKRTGIDISDSIIYSARELVKRHNELVMRLGNASVVKMAEEIEQKHPNLPQVIQRLAKYEYEGKEYKIVAPTRTEDILMDSLNLSLCIHTSERYFERMSMWESYILFLRKTEADSEPYYTLEVEPDGTIRQKRTLYNRQLDDIKKPKNSWQIGKNNFRRSCKKRITNWRL